MARIADKHGLTNKYRPIGSGKRVVRRGRPRKYLFGPPKRSSRKSTYAQPMTAGDNAGALAIILIPLIIIVWCNVPVLLPLIIFPAIMGYGEWILKTVWKLPSGKWSMPASTGWLLLTGLEMAVSFIMGISVSAGDTPLYAVIISLIVYVLLSILILCRRYKKIKNKRK